MGSNKSDVCYASGISGGEQMNTKQIIEGHVKMMGWSRSTYQRRIKRPGTITLTEFERMDGLVHFPDKVKALKDLTR